MRARSDSADGLVSAAVAAGTIAQANSTSPTGLPAVNGNVANGTGPIATPQQLKQLNASSSSMNSGGDTPIEETAATTTQLLQKFDVRPTGSRLLQGVRDVAMLVVVVVPFLVLRAARYILVWLGITEHRWKGASTQEPLSIEEKQQLGDVVVMLRSSKLPDVALHQAVTAVSSGVDIRPGTRMLAHLSAVTTAVERVSHTLDLNYDPARQQALFHVMADVMEKFSSGDQVDPLDVLKALRRRSKRFVAHLAAASQQKGGSKERQQQRAPRRVIDAFVFQLLMEMSRGQPPVLRRTALQLPDGGELVEVLTMIPLDLGVEFLRSQGPRFSQQVEFMTQYKLMRPSDAKKKAEVQAMTINARHHSLQLRGKDGAVQPVVSVYRSGGFATHGRKPRHMGLAGLTEMATFCQQADLALQAAVLSEAGFLGLQELQEEIETRRGCCVAQALPVVLRAVRDMCTRRDCLESAMRSGTFLYVQHSLLSDTNPREGAYLQDLKGALDEISLRLQIRFVFKPERTLEAQGRQIILYLPRDEVPDSALPVGVTREDLLSRTYGVTAVVFNCGVNILQSLGFFLPAARGEITQDICNRQAMERLNDYARQAGLSSSPSLLALNRHYSPGTPRAAKDVESVWLVRAATRDLGGTRAINCKSGKDRTAMEIALSFTQEATEQLHLSPYLQEALLESLQGGLSYLSTSQNNGRPSAYAFTEFELVTMPPGWSPAWKLCGKVDT